MPGAMNYIGLSQILLVRSWLLLLGSRHELHRLRPNSFGEILIIASWFQAWQLHWYLQWFSFILCSKLLTSVKDSVWFFVFFCFLVFDFCSFNVDFWETMEKPIALPMMFAKLWVELFFLFLSFIAFAILLDYLSLPYLYIM